MKIEHTQIENFQLINRRGAERARSSLSEIIGEQVMINPINISLRNWVGFAEDMVNSGHRKMGMHIKVNGDIEGEILFILSRRSALKFTRLLLKDKIKFGFHLNHMEQSALCEIANILTSSYIVALTDFTSLKWRVTVPHLCTNLYKHFAFTERLFTLSSVVLSAELLVSHRDIKCTFVLITREESFKRLLKGLAGRESA